MSEKGKSTEEMAAEYFRTAEQVKKRLDELSGNSRTSDEDSRRIAILRAEYKELLDAAHQLRRYNDEEDKYGYIPIRKNYKQS